MTATIGELVWTGIGFGILFLGYTLSRDQLAFEVQAKRVNGVVTEILTREETEQTSRFPRTVVSFAPVVEFQTETGAKFRHRSDRYISPNPYAIGKEVEILYDPANPAEAQVNHRFLVWFWPGTITLVGLALTVACLASLLLRSE